MARDLVVRILGDSKDLERAFARSAKSAQVFDARISRTGRNIQRGFGRSVAGASAALLGGYGLVSAFTSTINKAATFEKSLNVMQAVMGATAGQMKEVSAVAVKLGADITLPATSAADAAAAMTELAKGGLTVQDTMDAARGSLQLAAAANIEAGEAAQISARQLNAFQLQGKEATRVADTLANLANVATGEIGDFALAFQQSAAIANQFNLTIEQTGAALAVLANRGIVGSDAGTSFRVMLTRLVPQTAKATEAMRELGIKWRDSHGQILPFRNLLQQYHDTLIRLPPAQRQMAVQTIFGADAQRAANIIFGNSTEVYDKMVKAVSRQGAAAKLSAAQNKGFTGALDALKSAIETVQIQLGTVLLPILTRYLRQAAKWLSDTKNQQTIMQSFKSVLAAVGTILETVQRAFRGLNEITGSTKNTLKVLLGVLVAYKTIKIAGTLAGIASNIGLIGTKAGGTTGKVKGLRLALIGRAGLVGAVGLASYELSKMAFESSGWDKKFETFGATLYDVAEKLNMVGNESLTTRDKLKLVGSPAALDDFATGGYGGGGDFAVKAKKRARETKRVIANAFNNAMNDPATDPKGGATLAQRNAWFDAMIARTIGRIPDVGTLRTQIAAYDVVAQQLRDRYATTQDITRRLALEDQLWDVIRTRNTAVEQLRDRMKQDAEAAKEAKRHAEERKKHLRELAAANRESAQFVALGFTKTGEERIPGAKALRREAERLTGRIKGTKLDTEANRSMLKRIRDVLVKDVDGVGRAVRERMQQMFQDLRQQLNDLPEKTKPKRRRGGGIRWDTGPDIPADRHVPSVVNRFTTAVKKATVSLTNLDKLRLFADLKQFGGNLWSRAGAGMAGRMTSPGGGSSLTPLPGVSRGGGGAGDVSGVFGGGGRRTFGGTVVVNQHFQAPTTDRHREARYALMATRTVFDG